MNIRRNLSTLAALTVLLLPAYAQSAADHLQCMKIKDAVGKAKYTADLAPKDLAFAASAGCTILLPAKQLCVQVAKSNVMPTPPVAAPGEEAQRYLCYKTKCPKTDGISTSELDQFGTHAVQTKQVGMVCAPVGPGSTCSDGIQNGSEIAVDCGGPSCASCGTCTDGIKNGAESDVDCGGPVNGCPRCGPLDFCLSDIDCPGFPYHCSELYHQCEIL